MRILLALLHVLLAILASAVGVLTVLATHMAPPHENWFLLGLILFAGWSTIYGVAAAVPVLLRQGLKLSPPGTARLVFAAFAAPAGVIGVTLVAMRAADMFRHSRAAFLVSLAVPLTLPWIAGAVAYFRMKKKTAMA